MPADDDGNDQAHASTDEGTGTDTSSMLSFEYTGAVTTQEWATALLAAYRRIVEVFTIRHHWRITGLRAAAATPLRSCASAAPGG
jgi:hypothetical protein